MTTPSVASLRFRAGRQPVRSIVLWAVVAATVVCVLACLPALHAATNIHLAIAGALDDLDLGLKVPETAEQVCACLVAAWAVARLWRAPVRRAANVGRATITGHTGPKRELAAGARPVRRLAQPRGGSRAPGDALIPSATQRTLNVVMTLRGTVNSCGTGGSCLVGSKGAQGGDDTACPVPDEKRHQ